MREKLARLEPLVLVGTPLVTMALVALGLRIGGGQVTRAAMIYGAPRAKGTTTFLWQLVSVVDDRGVREAQAMRGLTVTAAAGSGETATWKGDTNADGVAEIQLDLPQVKEGDALRLQATLEGVKAPLAAGAVVWASENRRWPPRGTVTPSREDGPLRIEVSILGGALVPGFPVRMLITVEGDRDSLSKPPAQNVATAEVTMEPEPGLTLRRLTTSCTVPGAVLFDAEASIHVVSVVVHARDASGSTGLWAGVLPTTPGAMNIAVDDLVASGEETHVVVTSSTARRTAYVEVDDGRGRAFAAALPLGRDPDGYARAEFTIPRLQPGVAWVVASGEPRGAETLSGATRARPFLTDARLVKGAPGAPFCEDQRHLTREAVGGFPRFLALDGLTGAREAPAARARGRRFSLIALALGGALETLLLLMRAGRARGGQRELEAALDHDDGAAASRILPSSVGRFRNAVIALILALLGFGLLAALILR